MSSSRAVILYNADGSAAVTITNGAAYGGSPSAMPIAGKDGAGNAQIVRTANDGTLRVDPTGTTTQPVSGPLTDAQLRAAAVPVSDGGGSITVDGAVTANAGSGPWPVTDNGGSLTIDGTVSVAGTVPVSGPLTNSELRASPVPISGTVTANAGAGPWPVTDNGGSLTVDTPQLPGALVGGRLDSNVGAWLGSTVPTVGQKPIASSLPVTMASDQPPLSVTFTAQNARTGVSTSYLILGGGTANTVQVMRATPYTEPTSAAQRSLASSSTADTSAGTGARTVRISYYDNTGAGPNTEVVTLNGTTPVNTVATNIRFIESMEVVTVGSGGSNVGTITLFGSTGGGGGTVGSIGVGTVVTGVGDNRTLWCHHYVAAGFEAYLSVFVAAIYSGGSATQGRAFLRVIEPLVANSAEVIVGDVVLITGSFERSFAFNPNVHGFARVTAYIVPTVNNATLGGSFDWSEQPL